jgi:hypothetical protein
MTRQNTSGFWCVLLAGLVASTAVGADGVNQNYAYNPNPGTAAAPVFPHPYESDQGWGTGMQPQQIVDGFRFCNANPWFACGLAFTGGNSSWGGQACGVRQATIDFGALRQISSVRITHHGDLQVPQVYQIQTFNGSVWVTQVSRTSNSQSRCARPPGYDPNYAGACTITDEFAPVLATKVRYTFNNCPNANSSIVPGQSITHGWIYEFEAYRLP